jgi:Fur family transcriptional regulator, ferric uptake regulator
VRKTRTRQLVVDLLQTYAKPLSLHELHHRVRERLPKTAYSTVYRVISRLEAEGKVNRVDWRERGSRYEWAELPHHHHIVCGMCGRTVDIEDADLGFSEEWIRTATGFLVNHHSIELEGICPDCQ